MKEERKGLAIPPTNIIPFRTSYWSVEEHLSFQHAIKTHGTNKTQIQTMIPTRSITQIAKRLTAVNNNHIKIDPEIHSIVSRNCKQQKRWTKQERSLFYEGLRLYDTDWDKVEQHVKTRNKKQL